LLIGGTKSADGADGDDEGTDDQVEKVNAIINTFNYMDVTLVDPQDTNLSKRKKDLKRRLVAYVKKLKEKKKEDGLPEADIKKFAEKAGVRMNEIFKNFEDLSYYLVNEDFDEEGCVPIGRYNDDGSITFYYFLDGLRKEKS
jgi:NACalpha-BTF3-like transcription factor